MFEELPKIIVYTRHPQCLHNVNHAEALRRGVENRFSPLTEVGEIQRDITAQYLIQAFGQFDAVYATEFVRTHTIPKAAGFQDIMQYSAQLNERNMGVWHVMPRSEVLKRYRGEELRLKEQGYYHYRAPEGNNCEDVESAHVAFLRETLKKKADCVYISGHGVAGLCLRRILTKASVADWYRWFEDRTQRLKNGSVTVYNLAGDHYEISLYNHIPWEGKIDLSLFKQKSVEA